MAARCPACSATLRPGAPWCTLCYADLRPPEPEPVREPEPVLRSEPEPEVLAPPAGVRAKHAFVPEGAGHDRRASPAPRTREPDAAIEGPAAHSTTDTSWPCTACHSQNPLPASECTVCGAGFLAALRDEEPPLLVIPGIGDLARLSRVQRLALAAAVVLVIGMLTLVLSVLTS